MLIAMAWRNLWRHGRRTLITASALAVSLAFVMAMLCFMDGMFRKMTEIVVDQASGHLQIAHPGYARARTLADTVPQVDQLLQSVLAQPGTRAATPRMYGFALLGSEEETQGVQLQGVDPVREQTFVPFEERMVKGRWLSGQPRELVLGEGLARKLRVDLGAQLVAVTQAADGSLGNELYEVVGVLSSGSALMDKSGAWMAIGDLQELLVLPDQAHELVLLSQSLDPRQGDPQILALAEQSRQSAGETLAIRPWWEVNPAAATMLGTSDATAWIAMVIIFAVAGLGVLNTMLMSVFERTRELGVMGALGTRPSRLVSLVLWESLLLGLLASAGGVVLGLSLDALLVTRGLNMSADGERMSSMGILFDPVIYGVIKVQPIVTAVGLMLVIAVLAAVWPAIRAARLRPVDAMRVDA